MKAISPIIAIIIILLITIAIAGSGYSYISMYWTSLTGKEIQVLDTSCLSGRNRGRIVLKNIGTSNLSTSDITVINAQTGQDISNEVVWGHKNLGAASDPGLSCSHILENGAPTGDGAYWIDPDGAGGDDPFQVYCDMTYDGGGWTMLMKATQGTTFNYEANYWTTANTLNENDATRNDADAKYMSFNELEITDIMARWPDAGDIRWLKNSAWSTRTALQGFNEYRNWGNPQDQIGWSSTYFSTQGGNRAHGTKLKDLGGYNAGARWGNRWNNENNWGSDDVGNGIGLWTDRNGAWRYSAGDWSNCCRTSDGMLRSARVEVYGRESEITSSAEISVQPGETATMTHACSGLCSYRLLLGSTAKETTLEC